MQSWSNAGQNGSEDHGQQWQQNYDFAGQNGQFDHSQNWSQPMVDQAAYSHSHLNNHEAAPSNNFFNAASQQNAGYLPDDIHNNNNSSNRPDFHGGHDSMQLAQQFAQSGQQAANPGFHGMHQDLYGQQGNLNVGEGMDHLGRVQNHPHAHSQAFQQHDFSFAPQKGEQYNAPSVSQYGHGQPQLVQQQQQQQSRQQTHTPVQQFHNEFGQAHGFSRPQQSPVQQVPQVQAQTQSQPPQQLQQHQPQQQQQQQPGFSQNQPFPRQANGHGAQYDPNAHMVYQHHQQQSPPQQQPYNHSSFVPPKSHVYQQPEQPHPHMPSQYVQQQPNHPAVTQRPQSASSMHQATIPPPAEQESTPSDLSQTEPAPKKRKRAVKTSSEPVLEAAAPTPTVDSPLPIDIASRKSDEIDGFEVPVPTAAEAQQLAQFAKRSKTAQARFPSIQGLSHLLFDGTIRLPAPKSYDKLAPLVALPSKSGKRMVPELGYNLPCELQGRFTSQYRPSPNKSGLDDRKEEAAALLDEYDRSMGALGKRRPKYTEYPHAFKEQLKSDEASKNKAEKKAKKELEDERNKPVRSPTRPTDPVEAAAWDTIGIVHVDQSTPRTNALIAGRVQQAGDFFIKLRGEMTRAKSDLDQATKDKANEAELSQLKLIAEQKKEALYRALDATIDHADDGVLDNLGGHQKLILSLVNVLIGCIKASDFAGKLPKMVLELFTNFRMTKKIAETTNFDTVRKRFADKGDDEVKELVKELSQKIKKVLKAAAESDSSSGYSGTSAASRAKTATKPVADSNSNKRSRDDEPESRTVKKVAMESGSNSLSKKLAQPKTQGQLAAKISAAKPPTSGTIAGKVRPLSKPPLKGEETARHSPTPSVEDKSKPEAKNAAAKAESGLSSSKMEALASAAKSAPSASALSGIASLLDSINAPKTEPLLKLAKEVKETNPLETPDEKAKRLRKEARRKLRVSWKPESELVQVKIFQKDDGEDEGRETNMIRDAADDRSEGMVLKQRANVEEDDDEEDIPYQPWSDPIATDFSNLPEDTRNKNYVTRGGNVSFTTEEQRWIADREQRELMAIYTDPSDIPPTPKSPPPEPAGDSRHSGNGSMLPQDDGKFQEIHLRWRDEQQLGPDGVLYAAIKRLESKHGASSKLDSILGRLRQAPSGSSAASQPIASSQSQGFVHKNMPLAVGPAAEEQILAWLASEQVTSWHEPEPILEDLFRPYQYQSVVTGAAGKMVEASAKRVAGKPFPATSPPEWLAGDEERIREWWHGYDKEKLARQRKAEEEKAKAEAQANALRAAAASQPSQANAQDWSAYYAQHPSYAPYLAMLQQAQSTQAPAPTALSQAAIGDSQINSILAAINQPQQQQAAHPSAYLNPNDPSYQQLSILMQMAQGQQNPEQHSDMSYGGDRGDRDRGDRGDRGDRNDRGWDRNDDYGRHDHQKEGGRKKKATLPPHKPANKALIGTKPCTFWQQGKCARGDKCTFRHD